MNLSLNKFLKNDNSRDRLFIYIAGFGVILFIIISSVFTFKDRIFSLLFQKRLSHASAISANDWAQVQKTPARTGYSAEQINPPYTIKWKWNTDQTNPVRLSHKTQPIVAYGKAFIGGFDGKMYAIDATATGSAVAANAWTFQAGGPITNSAATDQGILVFGADDGKVYGLDANSGTKIWEYQTGASIDSAPLIVVDTVYIGSKDGNFYAFNLNPSNPADPTTILKWKYAAGGPIYQTAAFSQTANAVIFGAEDMVVYALNTDGTLKWKSPKLNGRSFANFWPVISESKGVVIVRSAPSFHQPDMLVSGQSVMTTANGGSCPVTTADDPAKRASEQVAIKTYYTNNPDRRTFFTLNLTDGTEKFTAPVLYTAGSGSTTDVPVIDTDGNAVVIWRSCYSQFDNGSMVQLYKDLGKLDLVTGVITPYQKLDAGMNFRLIGDEESVLSLAGTKLYVTMDESIGNHDITTNTGTFLLKEKDNFTQYSGNQSLFGTVQPKYSSDTPGGHIGAEWAPAVISNGMIIWKTDGSALVAFTGQVPATPPPAGGPSPAPSVAPTTAPTASPSGSPTVQNLGNPFKVQFPDSGNKYARNVWDMYKLGNKIYLGHGDANANTGGVPLWSIDTSSGSIQKEPMTNGVRAPDVSEEAIYSFREVDTGLGNQLTFTASDPVEFGANQAPVRFYRLESGGWKQVSGANGSLVGHVWDIYRIGNTVVAGTPYSGILLYSTQAPVNSNTWTGGGSFGGINFFNIGSDVYTSGSGILLGVAKWNGTQFALATNLVADTQAFYRFDLNAEPCSNQALCPGAYGMMRHTVFGSNTVYIGVRYVHGIATIPFDHALFSASSAVTATNKANYIGKNTGLPSNPNWKPWDLLVNGSTLYVLGSMPSTTSGMQTITVHSTTDLNTWTEAFRFDYATFARSFEYANGYFYFGMGSHLEDAGDQIAVNSTTFYTETIPNSAVNSTGDILRRQYP